MQIVGSTVLLDYSDIFDFFVGNIFLLLDDIVIRVKLRKIDDFIFFFLIKEENFFLLNDFNLKSCMNGGG